MAQATEIIVTKVAENQLYIFTVRVKDAQSETEHKVSLNKTDYIRITDGHAKPEVLVKEAFKFLLEHEPKEQILKEFDFTAIGRYFPTFNKEILKRIDAAHEPS